MKPPVRIGIIGCGDVLTAYLTPIAWLRGRGLAEVVVACSRGPEKRRRAGNELGVARLIPEAEHPIHDPTRR